MTTSDERPWNHGDAARPFSVTEWGSHPDEGNDDCWTGSDFASLAEAEAEMARLIKAEGSPYSAGGTAYVMLDGPGVCRVEPIPAYHSPEGKRRRERKAREDRAMERHERAMEAGMAFGCDGYNDAMGY